MRAHIVLIDDEELHAQGITMSLLAQGYKVTSHTRGKEGLRYLCNATETIDIILLDMVMPDIHGLSILSTLAVHPRLSHIPVILQTGLPCDKEVEQGLMMGAIGYLAKPFSRKELLSMIHYAEQFLIAA